MKQCLPVSSQVLAQPLCTGASLQMDCALDFGDHGHSPRVSHYHQPMCVSDTLESLNHARSPHKENKEHPLH
jgi:hypothetical protein